MLQRLGERKTPAFLFFGISKNSQEQNDSSSLRFWWKTSRSLLCVIY